MGEGIFFLTNTIRKYILFRRVDWVVRGPATELKNTRTSNIFASEIFNRLKKKKKKTSNIKMRDKNIRNSKEATPSKKG